MQIAQEKQIGSHTIYTGYTDDILKSLVVGTKSTIQKNSTHILDSNISVIKSTDLPGVVGAGSTSYEIVNGDGSNKLAIFTDTVTGVLVEGSTKGSSSDGFIKKDYGLSVGHNFGSENSMGTQARASVGESNKFGDKVEMGATLTGIEYKVKFQNVTSDFKIDKLTGISFGTGYEKNGGNVGFQAGSNGFSISFGFSM